MDYLTMDTKDWIFSVFLKMSDTELSKELTALRTAVGLYLVGDDDLVNSFVLTYLDDIYMIARDALEYRFLHDVCSDSSGCVDCSDALIAV